MDKLYEENKQAKLARRAARRRDKRAKELASLRRSFTEQTDKLIQEYARAKDLSYAGAVAAIAEIFPEAFDDFAQWPGRNLLKEAKDKLF